MLWTPGAVLFPIPLQASDLKSQVHLPGLSSSKCRIRANLLGVNMITDRPPSLSSHFLHHRSLPLCLHCIVAATRLSHSSPLLARFRLYWVNSVCGGRCIYKANTFHSSQKDKLSDVFVNLLESRRGAPAEKINLLCLLPISKPCCMNVLLSVERFKTRLQEIVPRSRPWCLAVGTRFVSANCESDFFTIATLFSGNSLGLCLKMNLQSALF